MLIFKKRQPRQALTFSAFDLSSKQKGLSIFHNDLSLRELGIHRRDPVNAGSFSRIIRFRVDLKPNPVISVIITVLNQTRSHPECNASFQLLQAVRFFIGNFDV